MTTPTSEDPESASARSEAGDGQNVVGRRQRSGNVTIAHLARETGLSTATISKVLNDRPGVSAATRSLVRELMVELGYRRRRLPTADAPPLIDIVFHDFDSPYGLELAHAAMVASQNRGLTLAVTSLADLGARKTWLDQVISRGTRGLILVLSQLTISERRELQSRGLPFVVLDPRGNPGNDVNSIGTTNWAGGFSAAKHLTDLGHRRIGFIGGPPDLMPSRARFDGYRAAVETAGSLISDDLVRHGDFRVGGGYEQGKALLKLAQPPTAIFAGCDLQAFGVIEAAREARCRVPEQLSVVGFDDLPISRWFSPPLTTVRQPLSDMATVAVSVLLDPDQIGSQVTRLELATDLVVRESTSPPLSGARDDSNLAPSVSSSCQRG